MCCVHNHTQTQISIHCRNTIRYCRHLYISGGSYNVFIWSSAVFYFSKKSKPVLCLKKKKAKHILIIRPSTGCSSHAILSILGCDFCISPIVSVPDTEGQKETLQVNQCFKEKALPAEGALAGTEASYHTISYSLLAFRSSTIRGGHMQGKGHEVMWHAMQHFSLLLHRRSVTATTDEDVSVQHSEL